MGMYDTLMDGKKEMQIKFTQRRLDVYKRGTKLDIEIEMPKKFYVLFVPYFCSPIEALFKYNKDGLAYIDKGYFKGFHDWGCYNPEEDILVDSHGEILIEPDKKEGEIKWGCLETKKKKKKLKKRRN